MKTGRETLEKESHSIKAGRFRNMSFITPTSGKGHVGRLALYFTCILSLAIIPGTAAEDNVYLITFYTGSWFMGGTDASIFYRLQGTQGESGLRWIRPAGSQFEVGGVDTFQINTDYGAITKVMIGHDSAGTGSSWHFYKLVIRDLVRDQTLTYACDCWVPTDVNTPSHIFTENLDECSSDPCQHGASCVDALHSFRCACAEGWTGELCETDVDECSNAGGAGLCENGGQCQNEVPGFTCLCPVGYTGQRCEEDVDECESTTTNDCQNEAICVNTAPGYTCICKPGFQGDFCQDDVDECVTSEPCSNNGTCANIHGGYVCACVSGWTGENCSVDIDECSELIVDSCTGNSICSGGCPSNSTCMNTAGSYHCHCPHGYTGSHCHVDINECLQNATWCDNGATCINTEGSWLCVCPDGYQGDRCEEDLDECLSEQVVCLHEGQCNNTVGGYYCICSPGYSGHRCENNIDDCASNPCFNEATCEDGVNNFSCICPPGYQGDLCHIDTNECDSNPCPDGETCVNAIGHYLCVCPSGEGGPNCEPSTTVIAVSRTTAYRRINDETTVDAEMLGSDSEYDSPRDSPQSVAGVQVAVLTPDEKIGTDSATTTEASEIPDTTSIDEEEESHGAGFRLVVAWVYLSFAVVICLCFICHE